MMNLIGNILYFRIIVTFGFGVVIIVFGTMCLVCLNYYWFV